MTDLERLARAAGGEYEGTWPEKRHFYSLGEEHAAYVAACSPSVVLALLDVIKAARAQVAAYNTVQDSPCGEFTGDELPACERADEALRAALAAIGEQQ